MTQNNHANEEHILKELLTFSLHLICSILVAVSEKLFAKVYTQRGEGPNKHLGGGNKTKTTSPGGEVYEWTTNREYMAIHDCIKCREQIIICKIA